MIRKSMSQGTATKEQKTEVRERLEARVEKLEDSVQGPVRQGCPYGYGRRDKKGD